jgi:hypothetical protein
MAILQTKLISRHGRVLLDLLNSPRRRDLKECSPPKTLFYIGTPLLYNLQQGKVCTHIHVTLIWMKQLPEQSTGLK